MSAQQTTQLMHSLDQAMSNLKAARAIVGTLHDQDNSKHRNAIFEQNADDLEHALTLAVQDLRAAKVIEGSREDKMAFAHSEKFVELVSNPAYRNHLSAETLAACESILKSLGWTSNEDAEKWGDFARQYRYAQNNVMHRLSAEMTH